MATTGRRHRAAGPSAAGDPTAAARVEALERLVEQYKVLLETSAAITATTDLQETLDLITRLVTERLDAGWCDLYDYSAADEEFIVVAYHQLPEIEIDASDWIGSATTGRAGATWTPACASAGRRSGIATTAA